MKKLNQTGVAHVAAIIIVVVIAVVGFVGWRVWDSKKETNSNKSSLTYENPQQSNNDDVKTSTEKYLEISEWGVHFKIPSEISDLKVVSIAEFPADANHPATAVATLDSPSLEAQGIIKTTGTQERHEKLGAITRQKSNTSAFGSSVTAEEWAKTNKWAGVTIGDYFYYYNTTYAADNADSYLDMIKASIESSFGNIN